MELSCNVGLVAVLLGDEDARDFFHLVAEVDVREEVEQTCMGLRVTGAGCRGFSVEVLHLCTADVCDYRPGSSGGHGFVRNGIDLLRGRCIDGCGLGDVVLGGRIVGHNDDLAGHYAGCIVVHRTGCGCPLGCAGALHHCRYLHACARVGSGSLVEDDSQHDGEQVQQCEPQQREDRGDARDDDGWLWDEAEVLPCCNACEVSQLLISSRKNSSCVLHAKWPDEVSARCCQADSSRAIRRRPSPPTAAQSSKASGTGALRTAAHPITRHYNSARTRQPDRSHAAARSCAVPGVALQWDPG
ncbi:hypothetical protein JO861_19335 [Rhodococcus hoagii]|uniref:hypothetical protein n=1 Tax=Rhodococcus hoagii TaxID=43767 RepID=UPI001964C9ED|nr:hypothetical protein [Prescottella equi]MBM9838703.1 hypothetical protein [Prescottella equi]